MNTLRFERLARVIEAAAREMDDAIPSEQRGHAGKDYAFGVIKGYHEAAEMVRKHDHPDIYESSSKASYPGWYTSIGFVSPAPPGMGWDWWCARDNGGEDCSDNHQGIAGSEEEAEEAIRAAIEQMEGNL